MGIDASGLTEFVVLENTDTQHNLVVCTLCSCYPRPILGRPPDWYKSFAYRSRAVVEPRAIMREFGTELPDDVEVRVVDSSADMRYLVLPRRPDGTEADRGRAGRAGHPRQHDRRHPGEAAERPPRSRAETRDPGQGGAYSSVELDGCY